MADLSTLLENTSITLPLDVLLELVKASQGNPPEPISDQTLDILKMELVGTLKGLPRVTEDEVGELVEQVFGGEP